MITSTWLNELDFSNWLHTHLETLAGVVGMILSPRAREARVGALSADLLATTDAGEAVIIENQIFKADHSHFGQVLTYAAFYDAAVIIWIARTFRNEYCEAISWLNRLSKKQFFAVELVGDGPDDCRFMVVAGPSQLVDDAGGERIILPASSAAKEEAQSAAYVPAPYAVRLPAVPRVNISPGQIVLNGIFEDVASRIGALGMTRVRKPRVDRNFSELAPGPVRDSHWALTFEGDDAAVALVFFGPDAHERVAELRARQLDIERESGKNLVFDVKPPEQRIKTKVMVYHTFPAFRHEEQSEEIVSWAVETFVTMSNAVRQVYRRT